MQRLPFDILALLNCYTTTARMISKQSKGEMLKVKLTFSLVLSF
jgi:hypothetical protein